jgi:hypothetical protein
VTTAGLATSWAYPLTNPPVKNPTSRRIHGLLACRESRWTVEMWVVREEQGELANAAHYDSRQGKVLITSSKA